MRSVRLKRQRQEAQRIISRTRAQADAVAEELEKARKAKDMSVQARTQLKKNIDKMELMPILSSSQYSR